MLPWIYLVVIAIFLWWNPVLENRFYHLLANRFSEHGLMQWFYQFSLIVVIIYFVIQIIILNIKHIKKLKRLVCSFLCLGIIAYLSPLLEPAERIDFARFLIIGFLAGVIINSRCFAKDKALFIIYIITLFIIPVITEKIHCLFPGIREGDPKDIGTGIIAVLLGLLLSSTWSRAWIIGKFNKNG